MTNVWPSSSSTVVWTRLVARPGTTVPLMLVPSAGVEAADFRLDLQVDLAVAQHDGQEVEAGAELLELHADLAEAGRHRDGLLAADEEAGRPAAQRHQPRLGQQLGHALVPQGLQEAEEAPAVVQHAERGGWSAGRWARRARR